MTSSRKPVAVQAITWIAVAVAGLAALAAGTLAVSASVTTAQPKGVVLGWGPMQQWSPDDPVSVENGAIPLQIVGGNGYPLTVHVTTETGSALHVMQQVPAVSGAANIPLPDGFTGCQYVRLAADNIPSLRLLVSDGTAACPVEVPVNVFTRLGIPRGGAPIDTVTDLLNYVQDMANGAYLENLPPAYRACLEKPSQAEVATCLNAQGIDPTAPTP